MATPYNGWTNYETWNLALWLGNDQASYSYWQDATRQALQSAQADQTFSQVERATLDLADQLKSETGDASPDLGASFYSDMLSAAISEVNWYEIAEHWINDIVSDPCDIYGRGESQWYCETHGVTCISDQEPVSCAIGVRS